MKLKGILNEVHPGKFSQDKDNLKGKNVVKVSARIQRKAEKLFDKQFGKRATKLSILHYGFKNPKDKKEFIDTLQKMGASQRDLQLSEDKNPCWDGYKQVGMKTKNGKQVPNCVKESVVNEVSDIKSGAVKMNSLVKDLEKELPKRISGNKKGILPPLGYGEPNYINFPEHIAMILKSKGISIEVDEFDKLVKTVFRNLKPTLTKTPNLIPSIGNTKLVHKKHKLDETVNELKSFGNNNPDIEKIFKAVFGNVVKNVKQTKDGLIKVEFGNSVKDLRRLGGSSSKQIKQIEKLLSKKYKQDVYVNPIVGGSGSISYDIFGESINEANAVSGGKIHKFITGKNLTYKGKKYSDIEFELLGIDNNDKLVKLKIIAPRNLFGQEMKVPFRTIRRGPFIKTDTSK